MRVHLPPFFFLTFVSGNMKFFFYHVPLCFCVLFFFSLKHDEKSEQICWCSRLLNRIFKNFVSFHFISTSHRTPMFSYRLFIFILKISTHNTIFFSNFSLQFSFFFMCYVCCWLNEFDDDSLFFFFFFFSMSVRPAVCYTRARVFLISFYTFFFSLELISVALTTKITFLLIVARSLV